VKINEVLAEAGFLNRLGAGIKGAVAGVQQSRDANLRKDIRQQSLQKELADWKRDLNAMRSKANVNDPAQFQKILQAWANARYPEATIDGVDAVDVSTVQPNNNNAVQKYISDMFNVAMGNVGRPGVKANASAGIGPTADIKDTLEPGQQYRFPNPDYPGTQIIVRDSGWYIDRLPQELRGQIKRDKLTGLYPVLKLANIKKYNQYYDQAAHAGKVKDEPAAAL
jgi:hypothetical protein